MATANTCSGITDLPVELVRHICSFLSPCVNRRPGCPRWSRGQVHMSRLSRTCKRLRDIVQPVVFSCYPGSASERPVHQLILLAQTLMARPDLAQHMKFLMFRDPLETLNAADRKSVQDAIVHLGLPAVPDHWNTDGEGECRLLPLELVLTYTPNLEFLRLPLDYDWNLHLLPQLVQTRPAFLTKLQTLDVFHFFIAGDRFDASMSAVDAIVQAAPNLDSLCLPSLNWSYADTVSPLSNLRRLYFQSNCYMSPRMLTKMLQAAPRLEVLAVHWDAMVDGYDYAEGGRATEAWGAVEHRKDSLRELRLDLRDDMDPGEGGRDSLKDFEKRNNMHARVDCFLSAMFPASIREVTLWRLDGREMKAAMLRFAKVVAVGRYPKLESVVLAPSETSDRQDYDEWPNGGEWDEVKEELEEEFGKRGVRFELRRHSSYWSAAHLD
ncbi:hypothetical protein C8A00DRAFT_41592 [Chaetomidium leptoderma]|uniref:F-box domain-containing protein n=1 Tax=Chaetomidium leptoderma TaxID=669021 RepID=A0AAN6VR43_9PEZI|nr:hypothetical protein C8A00DRAFT_41592 [Chaetomidium leptoderma]